MVDPEIGLKSFQEALSDKRIAPETGNVHKDILALLDQPSEKIRLTYALLKNGKVVAVAIFVPAEPVENSPCLNAGYAVDSQYRSQGIGKEVVQKAFDELVYGYKSTGKIKSLYVEAIVALDNTPSNKLALRLFSSSPEECIDGESGEPGLQYFRKIL